MKTMDNMNRDILLITMAYALSSLLLSSGDKKTSKAIEDIADKVKKDMNI